MGRDFVQTGILQYKQVSSKFYTAQRLWAFTELYAVGVTVSEPAPTPKHNGVQ